MLVAYSSLPHVLDCVEGLELQLSHFGVGLYELLLEIPRDEDLPHLVNCPNVLVCGVQLCEVGVAVDFLSRFSVLEPHLLFVAARKTILLHYVILENRLCGV